MSISPESFVNKALYRELEREFKDVEANSNPKDKKYVLLIFNEFAQVPQVEVTTSWTEALKLRFKHSIGGSNVEEFQGTTLNEVKDQILKSEGKLQSAYARTFPRDSEESDDEMSTPNIQKGYHNIPSETDSDTDSDNEDRPLLR